MGLHLAIRVISHTRSPSWETKVVFGAFDNPRGIGTRVVVVAHAGGRTGRKRPHVVAPVVLRAGWSQNRIINEKTKNKTNKKHSIKQKTFAAHLRVPRQAATVGDFTGGRRGRRGFRAADRLADVEPPRAVSPWPALLAPAPT